jgi:hypothetical protein
MYILDRHGEEATRDLIVKNVRLNGFRVDGLGMHVCMSMYICMCIFIYEYIYIYIYM